MIIRPIQLVSRLDDLGFKPGEFRMMDAEYFCPSYEWLTKFGAWLGRRNATYIEESYDCDDFAFDARCKATESHKKASWLNPESRLGKNVGHTVGIVFLNCDTPQGPDHHAMNMVLCSDDQWYFLEPQNGTVEHYETAKSKIHKLHYAII